MRFPPNKEVAQLVKMLEILERLPRVKARKRQLAILQEYEGADSIMIWRP